MSDQSIEEKKDDVIETEEDLDEESESQKKLQALKGRLEKLMEQISTMDSQIDELTEDAKDEELSEVNRKKKELAAAELREQKKPIEAEAEDLRKEITIKEYEQEHDRHFNKHILFRNIRELLKTNNEIKLGQIEKEAGCQPGYMSRLEKESSSTDPSMEFVVTAAKLFNTSIDILVNSDIKDVTPTEEYMLNFIKNLMEDTRNDEITWIRESQTTIDDTIRITEDPESMKHPLFRWIEELDEYGTEYNSFRYMSSFYPGKDVELYGNSYNATLPGTQSEIYFMSCKKTFGEGFDAEEKRFYELYIVTGYEVNPICCNAEVSGPVAIEMENLYKEAVISATHVHINKNARDAIDKYLEIKNAPF